MNPQLDEQNPSSIEEEISLGDLAGILGSPFEAGVNIPLNDNDTNFASESAADVEICQGVTPTLEVSPDAAPYVCPGLGGSLATGLVAVWDSPAATSGLQHGYALPLPCSQQSVQQSEPQPLKPPQQPLQPPIYQPLGQPCFTASQHLPAAPGGPAPAAKLLSFPSEPQAEVHQHQLYVNGCQQLPFHDLGHHHQLQQSLSTSTSSQTCPAAVTPLPAVPAPPVSPSQCRQQQQELHFLPWMPCKAVSGGSNSKLGGIGSGVSAFSLSTAAPPIDDILERWWQEMEGVLDLEAGKELWMQQQQLGESQHEELYFTKDVNCWARCQLQLPSSLLEHLWPNGADAAPTAAPKGPGGVGVGGGKDAYNSLKCQALRFVGPSELKTFGRQGMSCTGGAKQRSARCLLQRRTTQQQQQGQQEQKHAETQEGQCRAAGKDQCLIGKPGGGTVELYVIDKYTYTCNEKLNPSQVEKVMLAEYQDIASQEEFLAFTKKNVSSKGGLISDEWQSGIFELKGSKPPSYVRLRWRAWWPAVYTVKVPSGRKPKAASKATAAGTSAADASAGAKPSMSGAQQVTTGVTHVCGPASAAVFGQEFSSSSTQAVSQPGFAPQATQLLSSPLAQSCHNVPVQSAPWQHVQDEHARHQQQRYFGHGLLQQLSHGLTGPEAVPMISTSMLPHNSSAVLEQRSQQYPFQASTRCDKHLMSPPVGLGPTPLCQNIGFTAAAYPLTALPAPLADLLPVPLQGSGCSPVQASCDLAEPARWHPINTLTQQVQPLPPLVLQPTVQQQQSCYQAPSKIPGADYVWPPGSQFTGRPDGDGDSTAAGIGTCTTATESGNPANAPSMFSIGAANVNTTTASYIAPAALQTAAYDYRSEHIPQQQVVSSAAAEDAGGMLHVAPSEGFGRWCTDSITCTGNDRPILAAGRSASASCTTAFGSPHDGHYWPTGSGSGTASCYPLLSCQQNTSHHQSDQLQDVIVALLHDWQQGDGVESTAAGCDGVGDLLGNSWGGEVVSPSSNANISEAELEVLLRDPLAGATTRSALKKRRESDGSSSSDGGGASPSNPAASSGALCPPREYDAKKHVEAMMIFLPAFLKAELAGLDWMDVLRGVLKSLGTVSNMLRLRDFHDRGYGLFNMMLHAAIELGAGDGAEASPGGAAPGGRSTGDVSSGAGNRSSSRELELRLIQAFEVVMERLSEHGTDIPAAQAGKMLLIQQDRDCQDTPNHTCARYNLLTVQHWLLERCDAAMLLVATKDGWLPLATACRCGNLDAAVAYLRRANQLGLCGGRESNGAPLPPDTQQRALQLILSDLTPFNKHYREHNGRAVLEQAIQKVWPHGGAESVFDGFRDAENLKHNAERLQNELQGLGLA